MKTQDITLSVNDTLTILKNKLELVSKYYSLLEGALQAFCLTYEYLSYPLPPIDGWSWYDAALEIANEIPESIWSKRFFEIVNNYGEKHDN